MPISDNVNVAQADRERDGMCEEEWDIDYEYVENLPSQRIWGPITILSNMHGFVAKSWLIATRLHKLADTDQNLVKNFKSHGALYQYLEDAATDISNGSDLAAIQSIILIHPPLWTFEHIVERFAGVEDMDTSNIWAMIYLNVKLSINSSDKLRQTAKLLADLRLKVEPFNQYVAQSNDEDSIGMEISKIFNPLLGILHESILYLQRNYTDEEFIMYWPSRMEPKITEYLNSMEDTIRQLNSKQDMKPANGNQFAEYLDLEHHFQGVVKDGAKKAVFPTTNIPLFRTDTFVGRTQEMETIKKQLRPPKTPRLQICLIYGRSGVGKTQIALEYARRYREEYDAIFWIQCETSASIRTSFAGIAIALQLVGAGRNPDFEESLMKVLDWLKWTHKRWLLIYDNTQQGALLKAYWPVGARGSILLTSTSVDSFLEDEQIHVESVPLFNKKERWELLMAQLGPDWQAKHLAETDMMIDVEIAAAKTLLNLTEGLPLAITHIAKLVKNKHITRYTGDTSARGFLDLFGSTYSALPERQIGRDGPLLRSLDTIWSIAFKALSPNARAILGVLALLSPDDILTDLFFPANQARLTGKLKFCGAGTGRLAGTMSNQNGLNLPQSDLLNAIDELKHGSFIQKVGRHMKIHREVQEAVNYHQLDDLKDSFNVAVNLVYDAFPKQEAGRPFSDQWNSCQRWIQHAIHLANKYWAYEQGKSEEGSLDLPSADLFVELFANCAWYLFEIANYNECLNIIQIASATSKDKTSLAYAHLLTTEAAANYELNRLGPSRRAIEAAIQIRQRLLPQNDPEVAISLANLGNVEAATGNFNEALNSFEKAAAIREHIGETASTMLGLNYLQMGRACFLQGNHTRAYELYQKCESVFNKEAGRNRHYIADLHYAYGNLDFANGHFSTAKRSYELCRRIIMEYKPLHPLTSAAYYKMACAAFELNHHREALYLLEKAFHIAFIRSGGIVDGTCARVQWKRANVLLSAPFATQKEEGRRLKTDIELRQIKIAEDLDINLRLDELTEDKDREKAFDLLVPGYFR